MALRNIVIRGEEILNRKCKEVKEITPRIVEMCKDMVETMEAAEGVGLAAPQIGVMKRVFVAKPYVDLDDENLRNKVFYMINPEIIHEEGNQVSSEGCLSIPGYMGYVDRPEKIKIRALNLDNELVEYEFSGFPATVMCHENDHLNGILYCDKAKEFMTTEEYEQLLEKIAEEKKGEEE